MKFFRKLKTRRGMTLVEVLTVVALMTIMLAIAMPNLLAESRAIKLQTMNDYARAVAVAVQSRLYGMKNAGTTLGSEYYYLNNTVAEEKQVTLDDGDKTVKLVRNFGKNSEGEDCKGKYLLSGALTETDVLANGKIVVVYDPATADVLEVFYCEREFNVDALFPVTEDFLESNLIGLYRGEGAPAPERKVRVPNFECTYVFEDEVYLELTMTGTPSPELTGKHIGLEIYAKVPIKDNGTYDDIGIYFEGFFVNDYVTQHAGTIVGRDGTYPLTFEKIQENGGKLRFAIDSMVTNAAGYGAAKTYLRRQTSPQYVSAAENLLYPRERLETWFNPQENPYLTVWYRENKDNVPNRVSDLLFGGKPVTDYVGVAESMRLRVVISILSDETREAKETPGAFLYKKDEEYTPVEVVSLNVSPYFYAVSSEANKVTLSAIRDLNNLKYVFQTENPIDRAELSQDITGQELYDKLMKVRYALFDKSNSDETVMGSWNIYANTDTMTFDAINQTKPFTISGKSSSGRFAIAGVGFGGRANVMGGLFPYASNLTVEHLDIIDCWVQRNGFKNNFLTMDGSGTITGINATYQNAISGTLVGMAVNCTFDDVHVYIDKDRQLQVEDDKNTLAGYHNDTNKKTTNDFGYLRTSGVVAGGLVGIAIGSNGITTQTSGPSSHTSNTSTTFVNCSASTNVGAELYDQTSKCLYSGGLVGVTMGDVTIENSFAACQLGGYYAGGLVGGVAKPGNWAFDNVNQYGVPDINGTKYYKESGKSTNNKLAIKGSFSSGIILRQVRVGGGLIADIGNGNSPQVTGCYSSVKWQILPPTAYGTFEGDDDNYFIAQTYFAVPVTTNIEAHFRCKGDVFSLNNASHGIACANEDDLTGKLKSTDTAWSSAAATHYWQREVQDRYDKKGDEGHSYPFPMRTENNVFSGSWIMDTIIDEGSSTAVSFYNKDSQGVPAEVTSTFVGLFCAYYDASWAGLTQRNIDAGIIYAKQFYKNRTETGEKVCLNGQELTGKWWMKNSQFDIPYEGLTTEVRYEDGAYQFKGYAYNDPVFDPVKQDAYKSNFKGDTFIQHADTTFNWDYFGFYFGDVAQDGAWGGMPDDKSYYIYFDEDVPKNTAERVIDTNKCRVNPSGFSEKETFSLSESATIVYENGCFCVQG